MRIIAIVEVFRVVWTKAKAAKKPSKKKVRLQKERDCFRGMAEELRKGKDEAR